MRNPLGFCFPLQIRAFVIQTSLELPNKFKNERKYEINSGLSSNKTSSSKRPIELTFQGRLPCQRKLISVVVNFLRNRVLAVREPNDVRCFVYFVHT